MEKQHLIDRIKTLTSQSTFLQHLRMYRSVNKSRLFGNNLRHLDDAEIERLMEQGNRAEDWNSVLVTPAFCTDMVHRNMFMGVCVLGEFSGKRIHLDGRVSMPTGIYDSILSDSEIGSETLICRVSMVSDYCVESGAVLFDCGPVTFQPNSYMGNGVSLALGNENECRAVRGFAEMNIPIARGISIGAEKSVREGCKAAIDEYVESCGLPRGIVGEGARVCFGARVENSYVGEGARVERAEVTDCTLLSSISEPVKIIGDAKVRNSCIQWGSKVDSFGYVDSAVLCEHSYVERHGKVHSSIIGPNTGIAEGEVTSALLGPFIGFHHQALLIAALWPEGKGNVGYGANIGSNHTGKSPDQEILCGEGVFFGLGVNIKFPCNFVDSPYTIIATGVDTLPQKVCFPFSLINKPLYTHDQFPPAFNEIYPGWMLSDNVFAVMRNEIKYRKRNKASRMTIPFDIFRPDIVSKMVDARNRLAHIKEKKEWYLEKDICGLGKNFLSEKSRDKAIAAYDFFTEYYIMRGLFERAEIILQKDGRLEKECLYGKDNPHTYWEHQHTLFYQYGFFKRSIQENLSRFAALLEQIARNTETAKKKDDGRGAKVIDDYNLYHTPASKDAFVETMKDITNDLCERVTRIKDAVVN